jgi:ADP-heptose:LPS heptosyltransferase
MKTFLLTHLFKIFDKLIKSIIRNKGASKSILIVKVDGIGDYVLFRNFLKALRDNPKFHDYHITLCGNAIWKSLGENLDAREVNKFIWVYNKKFLKNLLYRFKIRRKLAYNYTYVLNATYSRDFFHDDAICFYPRSDYKLAFDGDCNCQNIYQKAITDKQYTDLFQAKAKYCFEFIRNKKLIEYFLGENIPIYTPQIVLNTKYDDTEQLGEKVTLIFPGSGREFRRWSTKKFAEVGDYLIHNYGHQIALIGAAQEKLLGKKIIESSTFPDNYINKAGLFSLYQILFVLRNARMLIANETGIVHIAAALNVKTLCISNGNHYFRFHPYPKKMQKPVKYIYPPEIHELLSQNREQEVIKRFYSGSNLSIISISHEDVISALKG